MNRLLVRKRNDNDKQDDRQSNPNLVAEIPSTPKDKDTQNRFGRICNRRERV